MIAGDAGTETTRRGSTWRGQATAWLATRFELGRHGADAHLAAMEGLRGFAVALVFLVHYSTLVQPWIVIGGWTASAFDALHRAGNAGVDLFFLLSGFLIYGGLMRRPIRWQSYLRRRVIRIYPAFLCVLVLYLVLSALFPSQNKLPADRLEAGVYLVESLLLLPGLLPIEPIITVAWSLSFEAFYYLAIPVLIGVFALRRRTPAWRCGFAAALALVCLASFGSSHLGRLAMFLSGVLLHEVLGTWPKAAPRSGTAVVAASLALCLVALPPGVAPGEMRLTALFVGFFVLCLACFGRPGGAVARAFRTTGLRWLGNMSYSYYLLHGLTLKFLFLLLAKSIGVGPSTVLPLLLLVPVFALTLLPAAALFLRVERPVSLQTGRTPRHGSPLPGAVHPRA